MDVSKAKLCGVPSQHLDNAMEATCRHVGLVPWILLSRHCLEIQSTWRYQKLRWRREPWPQIPFCRILPQPFRMYLRIISIKSLYVIVSHSQCWYWVGNTDTFHCCLNVIKSSISIKHQFHEHALGNLCLICVYIQNHSITQWTLCFVPGISRTLSIIFCRLLNKYSVRIRTGGFWRDVAMHTLPEATKASFQRRMVGIALSFLILCILYLRAQTAKLRTKAVRSISRQKM